MKARKRGTTAPPPLPSTRRRLEPFRAPARGRSYTAGDPGADRDGEGLLTRPADFPHTWRLEGDDSPLATPHPDLRPARERPRQTSSTAQLAPLGVAGLERLGLVSRAREGRLVPAVRLVPHDGLVIASDLGGCGGADHVPGVQRPSLTLANLTVRRPSRARSTSAPATASRRCSPRGMPTTSSRPT